MEPEKILHEAGPAQPQNATPETTTPQSAPPHTSPAESAVPDAGAAEKNFAENATPEVSGEPTQPLRTEDAPESSDANERTEAPANTTSPEAAESKTDESPASWWDSFSFEGKELTELRPDGMLMLRATPFSPERELQTLQPDTAQATVDALREKFRDVESKVRELNSEWQLSEDKKKLSGRVERIRDYLMRTKAIGDFGPLYRQVGLWDSQLQEGADKAYEARLALVEKAEALARNEEPKKEDLNELRELGEQWKATGYVDKERADALWARFEAARDSFYSRRRELQESERAELQSNLDLKTEIVDKAEHLAASENWKEATQQFNTLLDDWKKTGRTFHEKNEALWQRFITAKHVFFERKKQHFESIQTEQEANLEKKLALVERAEALSDSTEWNKTSDAYAMLMDEWKSIGRVPAENTEEIWARLNAAKDKFYNAKRSHFAAMRVTHDDNLAQKEAIVKRAEALQNSTDWRGATDELTELMEEWKKIGPVARREQNEALWRAFNKARHTFFRRKDEDRDRRRAHMDQARADRVGQVRGFLAQLRAELKEFEDDLADHHASMANLGNSKIDAQIRANLERLIEQAGPKMEKKRAKIAEVEAQLEGLSHERQKDKGSRPKAQVQPREEAAGPSDEASTPSPAETPRQDGSAAPEQHAGHSHSPAGEPTGVPDTQAGETAPGP